MSSGKVSVIIPVFRTEKYLEKCIDSVLAQTYGNFEIILIGDGFGDNSPSICGRYADISKRIPEYDGILFRQLFIQARAYMLSHPDEKSPHTAIVTGFFLKNK